MGNMLTGARPIHEVDVSRALHGRFLRISSLLLTSTVNNA